MLICTPPGTGLDFYLAGAEKVFNIALLYA